MEVATLDDVFSFTVTGRHPGAAVLVVRDGAVAHRQGYGLADIDAGTPITGSTAFYLCSLSKAFTATAVMLLAEADALRYDDHLARFLPELPPWGRHITVRHLLHHTGGVPDYFRLSTRPDLAELTGFTNADVLRWLCRREAPEFAAGDRRQYTNAGYVLLATIVARVSGQPFHRFLADRIFEPLGMRRTLVYDESRPPVPDLAHGYFYDATPDGDRYRRWDYNLLTAGGGGIFSCLDDMARWDQALNGELLVSRATLEEAYAPCRLNDGTTFGYGFGWEVGERNGQRQLAHTGGLAAYHARFVRIPERRLSVVVLANTSRVDAVACAERIVAANLPEAASPATGGVSSPG